MIPIRDSNPTERFPLVTVLLIIVNAAVFLYELTLGQQGVQNVVAGFALVPARLLSGGLPAASAAPVGVTMVTSMFLHGGFLHVIGNMLYLWIFGNNVEDSMGRLRFLLFYLLCGAAAGLGHALLNPRSTVPMIGASGAVSGVLGAYLLLYPHARVLTLFIFGFFVRMIEVPALIVLGFWFVLQFLNALVATSKGGGIAWYAHLGGFLSGMALIGLFKRRSVPFWGRRMTGGL